MRNVPALALLIFVVATITGCATGGSNASGPVESSGNRSVPSGDTPKSSPESSGVDEASAEPSDTTSGRVSAALESAGVENLSSEAHNPWNPDFSGIWRDDPAFAWIVDRESAGQATEVHGSAMLQGARGDVTAVVHGPELILVRIPCQDLVVDVAADVNVEQGTSDEGAAVDLARALYPALGC
jgi:hypothetical protein